MITSPFSFIRYLSAKQSVDDRALNRRVWEKLAQALPPSRPHHPLRVLEIGAGIGTMLERMLSWGLLGHTTYWGIDSQPENIEHACQRLARWAAGSGFQVTETADGLLFERSWQRVTVILEAIDLFDFIPLHAGKEAWDLLVAHAFLDLVDIPSTLPQVFRLLTGDGLFYFTLNFDGLTVLEPPIDPVFDAQIQQCYHRTMDERTVNGRPSGDSQSGRHLFSQLQAAGGTLLDAGSSDWVVFPGPDGYAADEAYFLHFIIDTIYQALESHPELDGDRLRAWTASRHAQIKRQELVYIAHQLDFLGRYKPTSTPGPPGCV